MKQRAFVIMPFGEKPDSAGNNINFDAIYVDLIKPALESANLFVFRADQEFKAGDIRTDMFQELLLADFVIADITLDNPNVWYELGVRHALRTNGAMLISAGRVTAFDLYPDRKLRYGLLNGKLDPDRLEQDKAKITTMVSETLAANHARRISPVYNLLPNLQEPDWRSLKVGNINQYWNIYDIWEDRATTAGKEGLIGNLLVLADEAPISFLRQEAYIKAAQLLRENKQHELALEFYEKTLGCDPINKAALTGKGICLQRLASRNIPGYSISKARTHIVSALKLFPFDSELLALLGRLDKDNWINSWQSIADPEYVQQAIDEAARLEIAIETYLKGFKHNIANYYPGINALTLMHLHRHLTKSDKYRQTSEQMAGAVRFAALVEAEQRPNFWAFATLADWEVLSGTPQSVQEAYKKAIARSDNDWFALDSCRAQLLLLKSLGFSSENVAVGITLLDKVLDKALKPKHKKAPRKVFLFSGHMVDAPDRELPRLPNDPEILQKAKHVIREKMIALGAGIEDIALTQGACGGDILFTEVCNELGVNFYWMQPFPEPEFIQRSVVQVSECWRTFYKEAKSHLAGSIRCATGELGSPPEGSGDSYPFERCNLWLLCTALAYGIDKVEFICLWDGKEGDGPGSTSHMYNEVKNRTGAVTWVDTRKL